MIQEDDHLRANVRAEGKDGAPGAIPTRDLPLRRRTLYATELREQASKQHTANSRQQKKRTVIFLCRRSEVFGELLIAVYCLLLTIDT